MMSKEAIQKALEALEETRNALAWFYDSYPQDVTKKGNKLLPHVETVLTALREALANEALDKMAENARELGLDYEPAQRTWVGLTDEQIDRLWSQSLADTEGETWLPLREFARAIEAAHGIKENT